jgi:hypothetical protein
MLAQAFRTSPGVISGLALLIGFGLIASRSLPLAIIGAALMLLAFFVPFIRLALVDPEATGVIAARTGQRDEDSASATSSKDSKVLRRTEEAAKSR